MTVLREIIANSGPHVESSGSGPIKKVQAGEVGAGFGLRYQAVMAKKPVCRLSLSIRLKAIFH